MRSDGRSNGDLRKMEFTRRYTKYSGGSVLVEFGDTKVLCTASVDSKVPNFIKGKGQGWLTAEYSMLPGATGTRGVREVTRGKATGRTVEIQRLIGRSLRAVLDFKKLGENTLHIDCDVLQADGGTRTASITGGFLALHDAVNNMVSKGVIESLPIKHFLGAISVGIYKGEAMIDLDYSEDSACETDMNLVMTEKGHFVEIQGTAEGIPFSYEQLQEMLRLGKHGILKIVSYQRSVLGETESSPSC